LPDSPTGPRRAPCAAQTLGRFHGDNIGRITTAGNSGKVDDVIVVAGEARATAVVNAHYPVADGSKFALKTRNIFAGSRRWPKTLVDFAVSDARLAAFTMSDTQGFKLMLSAIRSDHHITRFLLSLYAHFRV
jgi:hypothetical protein